MSTEALQTHPLYDPSIDYVGPMDWPYWALSLINDATLGEFNYAAFLHDIGATADTKLLRDENDKAFYNRLDDIVNAEKKFIKRQYLRFFKHFFYKAVRLNPSHYEGDEISIKINRALEVYLVKLEEERKKLDAERLALYKKYERIEQELEDQKKAG